MISDRFIYWIQLRNFLFPLQMNGRISWNALVGLGLMRMQIFKKALVIRWSFGFGHLIEARLQLGQVESLDSDAMFFYFANAFIQNDNGTGSGWITPILTLPCPIYNYIYIYISLCVCVCGGDLLYSSLSFVYEGSRTSNSMQGRSFTVRNLRDFYNLRYKLKRDPRVKAEATATSEGQPK